MAMNDENYRKRTQEAVAARKAERDAEEKATQEKVSKAAYDRAAKKYELERRANKPGTVNGAIDEFMDGVGDKVRAVGKFFGTNRMTSMDDEAQMQARKDVKGYKKGGMVKKSKPKATKSRGDGIAQRGKTKGRMI